MKKKIAVVCGGAGFLGSHLVDCLLAEGCKVIAIDNLITGSTRNIEHLKKEKDFDFVQKDIIKPFSISGPVDYVLNLASPASPVDYLEHPIETLKVGSDGTFNSLELAKTKKARYFLASTSEVYGDPEVHPQKESYWGHVNSIGPRSVYDEAKRYAEALTMAYHRTYKVNTAIVRIFNTYGPRMQVKDGRVVPNFIDQALHNKPLTIYGTGKQTRSFCYYSDLIDGFIRLLYSGRHEPTNIGNPDEFTILEFAQLVLKFAKTKSKLVFMPLPVDDPKQRCPDITMAKKHLKWRPQVKLAVGLQETMRWFQVNRFDGK
jgi:dTDP-glucose 4,6-dehydratase